MLLSKPVDEYLHSLPQPQAEIASRLRTIVGNAAPQAFGFWRGGDIPDP